jgi:hypothetical protein
LDTTEMVIEHRQLETLKDISCHTNEIISLKNVRSECMRKMQKNTKDIPFNVLYAFEENNTILR